MKNLLFTALVIFILIVSQDGMGQNKDTYRLVIYDFQLSTTIIKKELAQDIPDLFRLFLVKSKLFNVLERREIAKLWHDRNRAEKLPDVFDPRTALYVGRFLEANYSILGKISEIGNAYLISARLVNNKTGVIESENFVSWNHDVSLINSVEELAKKFILEFEKNTKNIGYVQIIVEPPNSKIKFQDNKEYFTSPVFREMKSFINSAWILSDNEVYKDSLIEFYIRPQDTIFVNVKLKKKKGCLFIKSGLKEYYSFVGDKFHSFSKDTLNNIEAGFQIINVFDLSGLSFQEKVYIKPDTITILKLQRSQNELLQKGITHKINQLVLEQKIKDIVIFNDKIIVFTDGGNILALNAYTLKREWYLSEYNFLGNPIFLDSTFFIHGAIHRRSKVNSYSICEININTGNIVRCSKAVPSKWVHYSNCDNSYVLVLSYGEIQILDPKTKKSSVFTVENFNKKDWGSLKVTSAKLFVLSEDHTVLYSYKLNDGAYNWSRDFERAILDYKINENLIIVKRDSTSILVLDESLGTSYSCNNYEEKILDIFPYEKEFLLTFTKDGHYYITDKKGEISKNGKLLDLNLNKINSIIFDSYSQNVIIYNDTDFFLYDLKTQSPIWTYQLEDKISKICLTQGLICVLSEKGDILNFGHSIRPIILGWIESYEKKSGTFRIRTYQELIKVDSILYILNINSLANDTLETKPNVIGKVKVTSKDKDLIIAKMLELRDAFPIGLPVLPANILKIKSNSPNSFLWIDNSFEGLLPDSITGLSEGEHDIKIVHKDKDILNEKLGIRIDTENVFSVYLKDQDENALRIFSSPQNVTIYVDNTNMGITPRTLYNYRIGQTIEIKLQKLGFKTIKERVTINRKHVEKNYDLKYGEPDFIITYIAGYSALPTILGWPENSITESGVINAPIRNDKSKPLIYLNIESNIGLWRIKLLWIIKFGFGNEYIRGDIWGLKFYIGHIPLIGRTQFGITGFALFPEESQPPYVSRGSKGDLAAPLQKWKHPIPNVFVKNEGKEYFAATFNFKPKPVILINLMFGVITNGSLKGTALIEDAEGNLIKDNQRSYKMKASRGIYLDSSLQMSIKNIIPFWRFDPSWSIKFKHQYVFTKYGRYSEKGNIFSLGLGILLFR